MKTWRARNRKFDEWAGSTRMTMQPGRHVLGGNNQGGGCDQQHGLRLRRRADSNPLGYGMRAYRVVETASHV